MASDRYVLKHFYYGQFAKDGQPVGDLRLLAKTPALADAAISGMLKSAFVPPLRSQRNGSWAVVRGKKPVPFVLVNSDIGEAGQSILHFVSVPTEMMRVLGGNIRALLPLIDKAPPTFKTVGNDLDALIVNVSPPTIEQEVDDMLDLMMDTKNRMDTLETLLSGVVNGKPVIAVNAPPTPERRVTFIAGLLALLPPSVRFAVTFATHLLPSTQVDAQIRFLSNADNVPSDAVIYDWQTGKTSGVEVESSYARFIVSQLRLDAELVAQQTRNLTSAASWRFKQGDRLADALSYASQRASVDDAVRNNQPVEVAAVSKILKDDPTLSDEQRLSYARHLMSLALAVNELEKAEPLGIMLRNNIDLSDLAFERLQQATREGAAGDVFDLTAQWLSNPMGPQGRRWTELAHNAALLYFNDAIDRGDTPEVILFLQDVDQAGGSIAAEKLMPQLIEVARPLIETFPALAQRLYHYAFKYERTERLRALLTEDKFIRQTPAPFRQLMQQLKAQQPIKEPGVLIQAIKPFKTAHRLILVRMVEIAMQLDHPEVIDEAVLNQLVRATRDEWITSYYSVLRQAVQTYSDENALRRLSDGGRQLLLGVLLAIGDYKNLATAMLQQSRLLYAGEGQTDYARMVQNVFAKTPIPAYRAQPALAGIKKNGIRSLPLVMAHVGTLEAQTDPDTRDSIAAAVIQQIDANPDLLTVMPMSAARVLLADRMKREDTPNTLHTARFYAPIAARYGTRSADLTAKFFKQLKWDDSVKHQRMGMLRAYLRDMDQDTARQAAGRLGKRLGPKVQAQLEATLTVKALMDGLNLTTYAKALHHVADFLNDTAAAYVNSRNVPSDGAILNDLESMPGGLNDDERRAIAQNIVKAGRAVAELGQRQSKVRGGDNSSRINALLKAEEDPQTAVEVLRVMGGFFSGGRWLELKLEPQDHPHPLPRRSSQTLLDETKTARYLLEGTLRALPDQAQPVQALAIHNEMQDMWDDIPQSQQPDLRQQLATDLQRVAQLVPYLEDEGDARALQDSGLGRRLAENRSAPRSALEFYRYIAGYYQSRA